MLKVNLKQLLGIIKEKKEIANSDAGEDPKCHAAKVGNIKRAKLDLEDLFVEYRERLKERAVFILVTGSESESYSKIASDEFGCFMVKMEEFYEELSKPIHPRLYETTGANPTLFNQLTGSFENMATSLGVIGFPQLMFKREYSYPLPSKEDLIKLVGRAINDQIGGELVGLYALNKVSKQAMEEEFDGKALPVLLVSSDQNLTTTLEWQLKRMFANVRVIGAGKVEKEVKDVSLLVLETIDKDGVEKSVLKIKKSLKIGNNEAVEKKEEEEGTK